MSNSAPARTSTAQPAISAGFRMLAEAVAIVLSILLAFAIDAAWDARQERLEEREALVSLLADFNETSKRVVDTIAAHEEFRDSASVLLGLIESRGAGIAPEVIDQHLFNAFVVAKTLDVSNGALDALLASGRLSLISNEDLRARLASWPSQVADSAEDERWIFNDVQNRLIPYLNARTATRNILRQDTDVAAFLPHRKREGYDALWDDPLFDNLLSNRLTNEVIAITENRDLAAVIDRIIQLIESELRT